MASITIRAFAPKCALPSCDTKVSYHNKTTKDGKSRVDWKTFCDYHRGAGKWEADQFKLKSGCANHDGLEYGFDCGATITRPEQLHINHKDGDHCNNAPDNIECLCANCHSRVTIEKGHYANRYEYEHKLPEELFSYE